MYAYYQISRAHTRRSLPANFEARLARCIEEGRVAAVVVLAYLLAPDPFDNSGHLALYCHGVEEPRSLHKPQTLDGGVMRYCVRVCDDPNHDLVARYTTSDIAEHAAPWNHVEAKVTKWVPGKHRGVGTCPHGRIEYRKSNLNPPPVSHAATSTFAAASGMVPRLVIPRV